MFGGAIGGMLGGACGGASGGAVGGAEGGEDGGVEGGGVGGSDGGGEGGVEGGVDGGVAPAAIMQASRMSARSGERIVLVRTARPRPSEKSVEGGSTCRRNQERGGGVGGGRVVGVKVRVKRLAHKRLAHPDTIVLFSVHVCTEVQRAPFVNGNERLAHHRGTANSLILQQYNGRDPPEVRLLYTVGLYR